MKTGTPKCELVIRHAIPDGIGIFCNLEIPQRINVRTPLKFPTIRQIRFERPQFLTALTWQKMRPQFGRGHLLQRRRRAN